MARQAEHQPTPDIEPQDHADSEAMATTRPLSFSERNQFQLALMAVMLGDSRSNAEEYTWATQYAETIAQCIDADDDEGRRLRTLIRTDQPRALDIVREQLLH